MKFVQRSSYHLISDCGLYTVCKCYVPDKASGRARPVYEAWRGSGTGAIRVGHADAWQEAAQLAEQHRAANLGA